jgi:diguanylate cyclase (GGDEF)-like protein
MLVLLALALAGTLGVLGWVIVLRRSVQRQADLLRNSEELFRHMALHDALTGLATRLLLRDRLDQAVEAARRQHTGLALLMVDLDHFKLTNDTFGHSAGDEVLKVTAHRLLGAVRKSDTVARLGGDEFVVLLPDMTAPQIAERIAATIVENLASPVLFAGRPIPSSVSVGVCVALGEQLDADTLLRNADAALYEAKARGRNRFQVYESGIPTAPMD